MAETSLSYPPIRAQMAQDGYLQEPWVRWFEQLWRRVGEANAPGLSDLERSQLLESSSGAMDAQTLTNLQNALIMDAVQPDAMALIQQLNQRLRDLEILTAFDITEGPL